MCVENNCKNRSGSSSVGNWSNWVHCVSCGLRVLLQNIMLCCVQQCRSKSHHKHSVHNYSRYHYNVTILFVSLLMSNVSCSYHSMIWNRFLRALQISFLYFCYNSACFIIVCILFFRIIWCVFTYLLFAIWFCQ